MKLFPSTWSVLYLTAGIYVCLTLVFLFLTIPKSFLYQKPILFFQDPTIADRVHIAIISDPNGKRANIARFFRNKASFAANNIFLSLARSTDPVFFFSLSGKPYYGDSYYFLFPAIFFPFFFIAVVTLLRKWRVVKKKYPFLLPLLALSLFIDALFVPYTAPIKLLPLCITVQLVIFFGWYEFFQQ